MSLYYLSHKLCRIDRIKLVNIIKYQWENSIPFSLPNRIIIQYKIFFDFDIPYITSLTNNILNIDLMYRIYNSLGIIVLGEYSITT